MQREGRGGKGNEREGRKEKEREGKRGERRGGEWRRVEESGGEEENQCCRKICVVQAFGFSELASIIRPISQYIYEKVKRGKKRNLLVIESQL